MQQLVFEFSDLPVREGVNVLHFQLRQFVGQDVVAVKAGAAGKGIGPGQVELPRVMVQRFQVLAAGLPVLGLGQPQFCLLYTSDAADE